MKKVLLVILSSVFILLNSFAQSVPQKFNYQGVARLANGDLIVNTTILVRFSLIPFASTEAADYVETHSVQTNAFGLFNVQIGGGTVVTGTTIGDLTWDASRFIKIELDADGNANGVNYINMGTLQLLSVPYSLMSERSSQWYTDNGVIYSEYPFDVHIGGTGFPEDGFFSVSGDPLDIHHATVEVMHIASSGTAIVARSGYDTGIEIDAYKKGIKSVVANGTNAELISNSVADKPQLLIREDENSEYGRISFVSSTSDSETYSDVWTLAGKTDAQTNANSRFHIYRNGIGNVLSASGSGNVGIGNSDPTSKLEVAGQIKITGGSPGNGKVLTSDANGLASWQTISGTGFVLPFDQTYNNSNTTAFIVRNNDGNAISGISLDGNGVLGQSSTNYGVDGFSSSNVGISGRSQTGAGGRFISQSGPALVTAGGNVGLGTSSPTAQLEVAGQVKITGGGPGNGKVLTSDANGLATWQTPSGGGGLTLPYSGTYTIGGSFSPSVAFKVIETNAYVTFGAAISGEHQSVGIGVEGLSNSGVGGYFSSENGPALIAETGNVGIGTTIPTSKLEVAGQVKITGGSPGNGKVLTSDASGLATWQTPSGGGGGGQWSNTSGGIYNTDLTNVGIGTSQPYGKLHVEGGQIFFTGNINDVLRVTGTGADLSAVGIQATNGTGLNINAKNGIYAESPEIAVKAVSTATSGGAGLSAESYSGTGAAVLAKNTNYSGAALKIENGGVVDTGGKWSYRATVNSGDPTVIWLYYPNPLSSDMIYLQAVGTGNGALNHLLEWDSVNSNWKILPATGTFDVSVSFNVMIIHAN